MTKHASGIVVMMVLAALTACKPFTATPVKRPGLVKKDPDAALKKRLAAVKTAKIKDLLRQYPKLRAKKHRRDVAEKVFYDCTLAISANTLTTKMGKGQKLCTRFEVGASILLDRSSQCAIDLRDKYRQEVIAAKASLACAAQKNRRLCARPFKTRLDYWMALKRYYSVMVSHWAATLVARRYYQQKCLPLYIKFQRLDDKYMTYNLAIRRRRGEFPFYKFPYDKDAKEDDTEKARKKMRQAYRQLVVAERRLKVATQAVAAFKKPNSKQLLLKLPSGLLLMSRSR